MARKDFSRLCTAHQQKATDDSNSPSHRFYASQAQAIANEKEVNPRRMTERDDAASRQKSMLNNIALLGTSKPNSRKHQEGESETWILSLRRKVIEFNYKVKM